jgi:hypothetical protein
MEINLRHFLVDWLNHDSEKAFEALANHDIRVAKDERYPNLFNLKYGSIMADKGSRIVQACRGAVVERDKSGKFSLVAYAFDRFFNLGEGHCHNLDWGNTRVYEKYDGSLIKIFSYKGEWIVSTSGSVAGASDVGTTGRSFAQLFWDVFTQVGYSRENLDPSICYIFELCHRDNRIVVDYEVPQLPLLAVRDRTQDLEELNLEEFGLRHGFSVAKSYPFGDEEAVVSALRGRGADFEGFILFDGKGRAKSKSEVYCQMHRARGNGEPDFSELFLSDDLDEFLLHFPEYKERYSILQGRIDEWERLVDGVLAENGNLPQKEFAAKVFELAPEVSGACFSLKSGKFANFAVWLESLTAKKLDALLGI